jgi:hypothetical protein
MNDKVEIGHVGKFWTDEFKTLNYVKQPVTQEEIDEWAELGYLEENVKSFTGSMYDSRNILPDWTYSLENMFGLHKQTYTFYRMDTLEIMPIHSDHFRTYCRLNETTSDQVYRIILMLEDWKPGHYFEMNGVAYVNWKAGDWFKWRGDVKHAAANLGTEARYTLQITGLSAFSGQLNDLFFVNIPDIADNTQHPMLTQNILPIVNPSNDSNARIMLYMRSDYIKQLDDINHSSDGIDTLNKDGLHIYLFEPLNSYHKDAIATGNNDSKHTQWFYSEFDSNITPNELRADELDSIYLYAKRNNLTNITVHSCDYGIDKWYPYYQPTLTLVCDDLFLRSQRKILNFHPKPENRFIRNFISLNWRFTKHRQLMAMFLAGQQGHLSWNFRPTIDGLFKDMFFEVDTWKQKYPEYYERLVTGCDYVNAHGPQVIDKTPTDTPVITDPKSASIWPVVPGHDAGDSPALYNRVSNHLSDFYFESFIDIVNETRFAQPTANFSEKVFQSIQYMTPFILVAPPKTLEYVRSMGFKTFNEFWDESYDDELDHGERLAKIFKLIDKLFAMSNQEQRDLYDELVPILEHNLRTYQKFIERT